MEGEETGHERGKEKAGPGPAWFRPVRHIQTPERAAAQEAPGAAGYRAAAAGESRGGKNRRTSAGAQPRVKGERENFFAWQKNFHGP